MTKNEYINTLDRSLGRMSSEEKQEILYDYQEHFTIGLGNGQTEDQICSELGDPRFIARQYRVGSIVKQAEENKTGTNMARAVFAIFSLGLFNLIFILPVFLILVSVLITLYSTAIALTVSGIALFVGRLLEPVFPEFISIPDLDPGIIIFASIALTSFGILFCIADAYITRFFYRITIKYIKANIGMVRK